MRANLTHFFYKHALLLLLCLFVSTSTVFAVPAWNGWQTKSQPDGTTIVVRQMGDEFYSYWETQDGKLAIAQADGTFVVSSDPLPTPAQASSRRQASAMYDRKPRKAIGERNFAPRGLVILVEFSDVKFQASNNKQAFEDLLNKKGYDYNGATGSAKDYFRDQSNGEYVPVFDVIGPVTLNHNRIYYGEEGTIGGRKENDKYMADFVIDATTAAAAGCDFSKYDSDGDGKVDIVYFFYAGLGQAAGGSSETIWPHNWELRYALFFNHTHGTSYTSTNLPKFDGVEINNYACSAELRQVKKDEQYVDVRSGIGTFCHEFSHVIGLPDYYETTSYDVTNSTLYLTPREWSIMDHGSYNNNEMTPPNYSIFDKYFMGWATPKFLEANVGTGVTLTTDYGDAFQITGGSETDVVPYTTTGTIYYIENRQQKGWDAALPYHGMLLWKVQYDEDAWKNNGPNNELGNPRYTIIPGYGTRIGCFNDLDDGTDNPFPGHSNFGKEYTKISGCEMTDITEKDEVITLLFSGGGTCHEIVTSGTGCTITKSKTCVYSGQSFTVTFKPTDISYELNSLTVKLGSKTLVKDVDYTLTEDNKTLTIKPASITGDETIYISAEWAKTAFLCRVSATHCSGIKESVVRNGDPLNLVITPDDGYSLEASASWLYSVKMGSSFVTYNKDFTYDVATSTLHIPSVTGDLLISPGAFPVMTWYADGEVHATNVAPSNKISLPSSPGACESGKDFVGWYTTDYDNPSTPPTYLKNNDKYYAPTSFYAVYAVPGEVENTVAGTITVKGDTDGVPWAKQSSDVTIGGCNFHVEQMNQGMMWAYTDWSGETGKMYNNAPLPGKIHSIVLTYHSDDKSRNFTVKVGSASNPESGTNIKPSISGNVYTFDCSENLYDYFVLTNGEGDGALEKLEINYTPTASYVNYSTSCSVFYTVTFLDNEDNQIGEPQQVKKGHAAIAPDWKAPKCNLFTWDPADFTKVTDNMVVKAVLTPMPFKYSWSVTVKAEDSEKGKVVYDVEPEDCEQVHLKFHAEPFEGYEFFEWSDGVRDKSRELDLTEDLVLTASWVKVWKITWVNHDGEKLAVDYVHHGSKPSYPSGAKEPTHPADAQYTYTWSGWTPEIVIAEDDATYTATFDKTLNKYTVTFVDEDGKTVLQSAEVEYGTKPEYKGETPTKAATAQYTYTFAGWDNEIVAVTGNATYKATYNSTVNKYTVKFVNDDGTTVLQSAEVEYGTKPEYKGETPTKAATDQYTYTFTGWSPTVVAVTGNATYKATYKATLNQYTVTFVDEDGETVLGSGKYDYGVIPTYSGATPTKDATAQYTYTFAGWSPEVEAVAGNVTYTATYEATVNKYTVTFVDEDGKTVLQSTEVAYGTKPEYKGETPTKAADAENTYAFSGWTPEIVAVTGKATYTATYKATPIVVEPVEVTGETDIEKLKPTATTDIEVTPTGHLTVSTSTTIHSLTLEYSMDNYESGHAQLSGIKNLILDKIEVKMSFPTPIGPLDGQWFAIAVPFAVSMATGIRYEGADKPAIPGTDFIIEEYDGAQRAATQRGWKSVKADATLYPGRMYMFSAAKHATWYLKAADPKSLDEPTSVNMSAYVSTIGAHHSGWNGIANTLLTCASGEAKDVTYATMYNNKAGAYLTQPTDKFVFGAAVPFFVQTAAAVTLNFTDESASSAPLRAPQSTPEGIVALTLTDAASAYTDRAYWSLKADKEDTYLIGHDLQKMQVANAGVPQVSILAYGMRLSAHEVPFDGESQTIAVNLYAPAEGAYTVGLSGVPDGLSVLLTKNGNLLWDITSTPFVADLQAGDNSGYALSIRRIKEIGTGVNNTSAELNVQKVLLNDRIYILRDGKTYVITGECVNK